MTDNSFRHALQTLSGPAEPPPGGREQVLAAVGRRRRRGRVAAVTGAVLTVALVVGLGWVLWPLTDGGQDVSPADPVGAWAPVSESPLGPRMGAVSAWTGTEMLVFGGADWDCGGHGGAADCAGPSADEILHDGAAYDPATDTWRELAQVEAQVWQGIGVWTGTELVVVTRFAEEPATVAYDPRTDQWRELDPPPNPVDYGLWAGDRLVFWVSDEVSGSDWSLNPSTGRWTPLPEQPFGDTFDRSYGWTGDGLVFSAHPKGGSAEPPIFEIAALDLATGQWESWPTSPVAFWAQEWFVFDGHWVNATQLAQAGPPGESASGALDLNSGQWRSVPQATDDYEALIAACELPPIGAAGDWLAAGGGAVISLDPEVAILVPACDPIVTPAAAVWTGQEFVVWGGTTRLELQQSDERVSDAGLTDVGFRWRPPVPAEH